MKLTFLPDNPQVIHSVASWLYNEWLISNPDATVEKTVTTLSPRIESTEVPLTIVAFTDDGLPIGTASLTELDMKSHPEFTPWLGAVYVSPSGRGKGIASKLCKRIEDEAKRLGYLELFLFTRDQMSLYSRLGWESISVEEYRGMKVTIMKKHLG